MRLGGYLAFLAVAGLLDGCAAHRPPATVQRQSAYPPPARHVYYHPSAPAPAPAAAVAEPGPAAAPPPGPGVIDAARQEDLFRRFDQTRDPAAGDDASAR